MNIKPTEYDATTNTFYFYKDISLSIDLQETQTSINPLYRGGIDQEELLTKISNPEVLSTYPTFSNSNFYDYIIITGKRLTKSDNEYTLDTLIQRRESQGLSCMLKTVEDIKKEFTGVDTAEKIRNFIKHAYSNYSTTYILLAGDIEYIPIRNLYDIDGPEPSRVVSSDVYYQCLDGNYNYNNNQYWGEKYDGINGGQVDLYAEVYIGRAPAKNVDDISAFVEKTLKYEDTPYESTPYLKKCLSVGEYLWEGVGGYGYGYLDSCIDTCTDFEHTTNGIPSDKFTITKLYESEQPFSKSDVMSQINEGFGIINHIGHGFNTYAMKLSISDISALTNTDMYPVLYSQACLSGNMIAHTCFAEQWVNTEKAGGVAAIMNTASGLGSASDFDGPSNRYAREFFDALFSPDEKISRIGRAHQDSKEDNVWRINDSMKCMYHVYYTSTLFGDPYLQIKGALQTEEISPNTPDKPSGVIVGKADTSYTFTTNTTTPDNTQVKYLWDFGDGTTTCSDYFDSGIPSTISHTWKNNGTYFIRVKAKNSEFITSDWSQETMLIIGDFETPSINITNPEKALYVQGEKVRLYYFRNPLVFGKINITIDVKENISCIKNITFITNNNILKIDTEPPFTCSWDKIAFGPQKLQIIVNDVIGNYKITSLTLWKFF